MKYMTAEAIVEACDAVLNAGGERITLVVPKDFKPPRGFPRGELLSVPPGSKHKNLSFPAERVRDWVLANPSEVG